VARGLLRTREVPTPIVQKLPAVALWLALAGCAGDLPGADSGARDGLEAGDAGPGWSVVIVALPDPDALVPAPDASPPPDLTPPKPDSGPPSKKALAVVWQGQQTGYWCGPASTRIALSAKLSGSKLPSQQALATKMGTTTNGTDHIGLVRAAMNQVLNTSWYGTHAMYDPPTSAQRNQLKSDLIKNIGAGYAMVGNVISGWRPPGYPPGTIYHYIAIVGYDQSGDRVLIADPAGAGAAGTKWVNVPKTYWISTWDLGTWIGGKGYAG
jgi:hypothetical protein